MVGVEEGREFRFRGDLYSQESTFALVIIMQRLTRRLSATSEPLMGPWGTLVHGGAC